MEKAFLLVLLLSTFLTGCSSTSPHKHLEQFETYTGGQVVGDAISFYWVTNQLMQPHTSADYVTVGDYGWYQTDYAWLKGVLREFVREGEQRNSANELVPYRVHVRFNKSGEAVYQQYRTGSKILPLQPDQLESYQRQGLSVLEITEKQNDEGLELVQGYWNGKVFETCAGVQFKYLEFNKTVPRVVINRLALIKSYGALVGKVALRKVSVAELLVLADENHQCIQRPSLLSE
jgi:hypothetical protein